LAPAAVEGAAISRDFPIMVAFSVALFLMAFGFRGPGRINRFEGALLLGAFIAYQVLLFAPTGG
ncbi:MAG: calcium/sodium antiporter, partial [Gammaproteobacteria bacterium]|nr:calcium/sodium antiporter [Gammaproteobacteria bacterium]